MRVVLLGYFLICVLREGGFLVGYDGDFLLMV